MFKQKPTKKQFVALALSLLLPIIFILFAVFSMTALHILPNFSLILCLIIIPLIFCYSIYLAITSKLKTWVKPILTVLLLLLLILCFFIYICFGEDELLYSQSTGELENNTPFSEKFDDILPSVDKVGMTDKIQIYQYKHRYGPFGTNVTYLVCNYNKEEYAQQKIAALNSFNSNAAGGINNYHFRSLSELEYDFIYYPKRMAYIITNDETHEIIYMSFYDIDLDEITSFESFINEDCGWNRIVKKIQTE